jgi:hypothetical protein
MTDALEERDERLGGFVDGPALEDYAARYADHFVIQRNEGVVEVACTLGIGPRCFRGGCSMRGASCCATSAPTARTRC